MVEVALSDFAGVAQVSSSEALELGEAELTRQRY